VDAEGNHFDLYDGSYDLDQATGKVKYLKKQVTAPSILVGLGIKQPISDRTSFVSTVVYDVLQDPNSFYQNQIDIRFGLMVGF
jgi:methyl coenzyme M reductase gamma subunit